MDRYPHVHNDPSAFTGLCITIGMLAQSLPSGIIPALASSLSALMKSPIPSAVSKHSLWSETRCHRKKKTCSSQMIINWDPGNVTGLISARWWWVFHTKWHFSDPPPPQDDHERLIKSSLYHESRAFTEQISSLVGRNILGVRIRLEGVTGAVGVVGWAWQRVQSERGSSMKHFNSSFIWWLLSGPWPISKGFRRGKILLLCF